MASITTAARKANDALWTLTHNTYFSAIPLDRIFDIVEEAGFRFFRDEKECILCGHEGRATWELTFLGRPASRALTLSWYRMPSGRFEVVTYVS